MKGWGSGHPRSPDLRNDPGTVTIPQYRFNTTKQHTQCRSSIFRAQDDDVHTESTIYYCKQLDTTSRFGLSSYFTNSVEVLVHSIRRVCQRWCRSTHIITTRHTLKITTKVEEQITSHKQKSCGETHITFSRKRSVNFNSIFVEVLSPARK